MPDSCLLKHWLIVYVESQVQEGLGAIKSTEMRNYDFSFSYSHQGMG